MLKHTPPLFIKNEESGFIYYQNGEKLTLRDLSKVLAFNNMAYNEFYNSIEMRYSAIIFGFAGAFLVVYPIGEFTAKN